MYELVCRSADDRKAWIRMLKEAVTNCPEESEPNQIYARNNVALAELDFHLFPPLFLAEGISSENEEEKKLWEARSVRLRQLISTYFPHRVNL